jgi:hypothetical protein
MYIRRELLLRIIYRAIGLWVVMHYYAQGFLLAAFLLGDALQNFNLALKKATYAGASSACVATQQTS